MNPIYIEIIAIGDELLYGQTLDTNSHWISSELDKVGFKVTRRTTIGDREDEIMRAFAEAEQRASIVLITGGLGPTNDDLTKPCLAKFFDCEVAINEEALEEVTAFFKKRGRELTEVNRQQAALPVCCTKITNAIGTAPGMWFDRNGKVFVSMPGVPHEMKMMMSNIIIPKLKQQFRTPSIIHQIVRTIGIGESFLAEKIKVWEDSLPSHIKLAYLPSTGEVKLRLTGMGTDEKALKKEIDSLVEKLLPLAGQYIYCVGDHPIEKVVGDLLRDKGFKLSIAESCTGGYVSHLITSVPGSSEYFLGSMIPYDYELKMRQLGVRPETLEKFGAVSEPTIIEMANNVRARFNANIGVATSGIAGPGGATPDKPVGTIWIAYSDKYKTETKLLKLTQDRLVNIRYTSTALLGLIWQNIRK
ncbi:MAG: competence/damage-inducible protein A [Cyclobacteriaceae bacterium]|nr:competence/damage-inducible protein A [Cyclobacteriaceae bacterium]